jgi:hypothetical protein
MMADASFRAPAMSIAPILAASGVWAGLELLPKAAAGFQDLLSGLAAPAADAPASGGDTGELDRLLARLRERIAERLSATGIDPAGLELEIDSVGSLSVVGGDDTLESLLNSDPAIRSAALDLVAAAGETRIAI